MSSMTARHGGARGAGGRGSRRRGSGAARRRRFALIAVVALAAVAAIYFGLRPLDAIQEITLPLRHEDVIRQQAKEKGLDPALIAAVIYEESKFRDQTSHAGARGLMQITPATADFIARDSGGARFTQADLADPDINIRYGAYYLRYLMRRYDGDDDLVAAAYNAGETNVDRWVRAAGGAKSFDPESDIPFKETRDYVRDVGVKRKQYREQRADELGL